MNTTAHSKSKTPGFLLFILISVGLYLAYILIIFFIKCMVYIGYNSLFFLDNLFKINSFNPIVTWAIGGLFIGSIIGVLLAIKKFRLSKLLLLFPIGLLTVLLAIMYLVNKPTAYTEAFNTNVFPQPPLPTYTIEHHEYYVTTMELNIRSGPSVTYPKLFAIGKGYEVQIVVKNFFDKNHSEWYKVRYNNHEGYVSAKLLRFSRSD